MKKSYYYISLIVIGSILSVLSFMEKLDAFWSGMGSALLVVGIIRLLKEHRLNKNDTYRQQVEVYYKDERIQFIRVRAMSWSAYCFIIISAIATIIFHILNQKLLSIASSFAVCLMLLIYYVCYYVLKRKY